MTFSKTLPSQLVSAGNEPQVDLQIRMRCLADMGMNKGNAVAHIVLYGEERERERKFTGFDQPNQA